MNGFPKSKMLAILSRIGKVICRYLISVVLPISCVVGRQLGTKPPLRWPFASIHEDDSGRIQIRSVLTYNPKQVGLYEHRYEE